MERMVVKMKIPIVMVSDANYISQTRVAIWTMRENTSIDVSLEITVFCSPQLDCVSRHRLLELEQKWVNLKIYFYEVDTTIFKDAKVTGGITVASFYRLLIPEVLKDEEKCLFLDGDIIVNTDLRNMYLQNIEDYYMAGVRDGDFLYNPDGAIRHFNEYGFHNFNSYVNAGVIVYNLTKIREDNLQSLFLKSMETFYPYMDQDILNKVCDGNIKLLDMRYNYFNRCKNGKVKSRRESNKSDQKEKEWEILHFAGADKPWNNLRARGSKEWWVWAEKALEKKVFQNMYSRVQKQAVQNDWSYILERCRKEKVIIVIGYSHIGLDVFTSLKRCYIEADMYFCDNSKIKQSLSDTAVTIRSVEEAVKNNAEALWINTSQRSYTEINRQLKGMGIKEERIIVYKHKNELYFDMLDDDYIEYELNQLMLKNLGTLN